MKVCHFAATKGIGRGDAFVEIANSMAKQTSTSLLVPKGSLFLKRVSENIRLATYTGKGSRRNPWMLWDLYMYFRRERPDITNTHFAKATQIFAFLNQFLRIPHIATKHNPRKGRIFEKVSHATAVSQEAVESICSGRTKVHLIRNGLYPEKNPPIGNYIPENPFPILAVGRLDPIKGFDRLLKSLAELEFDFHLTIAGDGPAKSHLEAIANQLGIMAKVTFAGFRTDIPDLMNRAAIVVSSSLSEGCPMAMIESFFYANLFLSTPVGEATKILPKEFLCETHGLTDTLSRIYMDYTSYQQRFLKFAIQVRPQFHVDSVTQSYLKAYRNILLPRNKA
jgi:glycosyltransferase involved in cell wall biosynthesis